MNQPLDIYRVYSKELIQVVCDKTKDDVCVCW